MPTTTAAMLSSSNPMRKRANLFNGNLHKACACCAGKSRSVHTERWKEKSKSLMNVAESKDKQLRNEIAKIIPSKHIACVERIREIETDRAKLVVEGHAELIETLAEVLFNSKVFDQNKGSVMRRKFTFYGDEDKRDPSTKEESEVDTDSWNDLRRWNP